MKTIIFIDNVIGGGKTTLILELLKRHPDWGCIDEGIDFDVFSEHISNKSKEDIFMCQTYRNYVYALKSTKDILLADRTYDSVYRWTNATGGKTTRFIKEITACLKTKLAPHKKLYICIEDYDLKITLENIKARGRTFEQHYTKDSLLKLKRGYRVHFPGFSCEKRFKLVVSRANYPNFPQLAENFILANNPPLPPHHQRNYAWPDGI